jgi:nicotinamide-nucleotide amidase
MPSAARGGCVTLPEAAPSGGLTAEIVAVGTELLHGDGLDTNSAWLSGRLVELGIDVRRHTSVGDDLDDLADVVQRATRSHDIVIVTGGLGPTQDDVTRFAIADVAGVALERHADLVDGIRAYFDRLGRDMPERNLLQADLPHGARVIPPVGTAPGFALDIAAALVVCLPGVPREVHAMTDAHVIPLLQRRGGLQASVTRTVRTAGASESAVAERCAALARRLEAAGAPRLAFLASRAETRVCVTVRAPEREAALALAAPVVDELVELLGDWVVGLDDEGTEHAVARLLRRHGWTLSVAESITGGGLGARLVTVPGASEWFTGGVIAYATRAKPVLADVPPALLDVHGPVSEEVAVALAAGVRMRLETTVGLGVVGVAGPTMQAGRAVGTLCVGAVLADGASHARTVQLPLRPRQDMQEFGASIALDFLRRRLAAAIPVG